MLTVNDQSGNSVVLASTPQRIISIVPSQTELLYDFGLDETVIGITKFCVHPAHWFRSKTRIGGTKNLHIEKILALRPDLILANKEENVREQVVLLRHTVPVWVSDIQNTGQALDMIKTVGLLVDQQQKAAALTDTIRSSFHDLQKTKRPLLKVAYLIWRDPYMTVGGDTFIHDMLERCGFENVYRHETRYPSTSVEALKAKDADVILLSSEPYPFKQKHIDELHRHLPGKEIILADGEMFSWYGSRMQFAARYFEEIRSRLHCR